MRYQSLQPNAKVSKSDYTEKYNTLTGTNLFLNSFTNTSITKV